MKRSPLRIAGASALALVLGGLAVLAARADEPASRTSDELVSKVRKLLDDGKAREALATIERSGRETAGPLLVLRGEAKLDLGRITEATTDLERASRDAKAGPRARVLLGKVEFLRGHDDKARTLLKDPGEGQEELAKTLQRLMDGPFLERWGDAGRICRGRSRDGRYLVYTDLGTDDAGLEKATEKAKEVRAKGGEDVDKRLDRALPPTEGVKTCAKLMDTIARAYAAVFPQAKDEQLVHRVYLFAAREDFDAFSESLGEDGSGAVGFYMPDTRILVVDAEPQDGQKALLSDDAKDTMFHEGFHQFIRFCVPDVPAWFDEGLAEYFGPSRIAGKGELEIGVVKKTDPAGGTTRYETIRGALRNGKPLPPQKLRDFLTTGDETFADGERGEVNYAQAWSLMHFLLSNERGKTLIGAYWKALKKGKDSRGAFEEVFAREDLDALERDWKKHVEGM